MYAINHGRVKTVKKVIFLEKKLFLFFLNSLFFKVWENPCTEETLRSNEILQFKDPWDRNSYVICTDINIYHSMPCSIGTYFNEKLHHCVPEGYDPPSCPDKHCKNDADCFVDEGNHPRCVCKKGFTGEFCENNIDECLTVGSVACRGKKILQKFAKFFYY